MRRAAVFRAVAAALLILALSGMAGRAGTPNAEAIIATAETLRDFMTQDVCLDAAENVLPRHSPIDDPGDCPRRRDLQPGERLPYHKHDHPSPAQIEGAPAGYQRHDSFPVATAALGIVIEHSFDFGAGDGRRFGAFDRGADGGDIAVISPQAVSLGATEDSAGFTLWVGECHGAIDADALTHSWVVAQFDPQQPALLQGDTIAQLNSVSPGQAACPARFNAAFTTWRVAPFRYRAAPGQGDPVTLTTLISEHYGGADRTTADHVERFYFTRELGGTRWERWQNAVGNRALSAAKIAEGGAAFAASGRCRDAQPPAGASFVLIDCREWTRIVSAIEPAGDLPGFFIEAIRGRPNAPAFFAAPQN